MDKQEAAVKEQENFIFQLLKEIDVSKAGVFEKTASFEFTAPTMKQFKTSNRLSQLVMRAFMDKADLTPPDNAPAAKTEEVIDLEAIKMILLSSESVDFNDIADTFMYLATGVGTAMEGVPLHSGIFDKLTPGEVVDMVCGYIAHFTYPSLFVNEG